MPPQQKQSFLPYLRGINPEDLRLGSLYLNPLDPDDGLASKRFEYRKDPKQSDYLGQSDYEEYIKSWIRREQKDPRGFSIDFQGSRNTSMALKFSDFFNGEASNDSTVAATLKGESGRRLKLKDPEAFLRDEVIVQPKVQEWIRTQASILFKGFFGKHKFKAPQIWMVSGVQLVTGGDVKVGSSKSINGTLGMSGDLGPAFGAPPGMASIGAEVSHGHDNEANNEYGHNDERVWAAQFMEVKIEYGAEEDITLTAKEKRHIPMAISTFHLEDIADLGSRGIRTARNQRTGADGEAFVKPPKLVASIVVDTSKNGEGSQDDASVDVDDIKLDDYPYLEVLEDIDWNMYDECSKYLRDAKTRGIFTNPEPTQVG